MSLTVKIIYKLLWKEFVKESTFNRIYVQTLGIPPGIKIEITGTKKQPEKCGAVKERLKYAYCSKIKNWKIVIGITQSILVWVNILKKKIQV